MSWGSLLFSVKTTDHIPFFSLFNARFFMLDQVGDVFILILLFLSVVAED